MSADKSSTRRRRWLKPTVLVVLALPLLLLVFLAWLTTTTSGSAFILTQVGARIPGTLSHEDVQGSLAAGLHLRSLVWQDDTRRVDIDSLALELRPSALLRATLIIEQLHLKGVQLTTTPGPASEPTPLVLPEVRVPIHIVVERLAVESLALSQQGATLTVGFKGDMAAANLAVESLTVASADWQVAVAGSLETAGDYPIGLRISWQLPAQNLAGDGRLDGSLASLHLDHTLIGDYPVISKGRVELAGRVTPFLDLQHTCDDGCSAGPARLQDLRLSHSGDLDAYDFELGGSASGDAFGATNFSASGQGTLSSVAITKLQSDGDAVTLDLAGKANWGDDASFSLTGGFGEFNAGLLADKLVGRIGATIDVSGSDLRHFDAALHDMQGDLNGYALTAHANVRRSGDDVQLDDVNLLIGDNKLSGAGRLSGRVIEADFTVAAPALVQLHPEVSGAIDANGRLAGSIDLPALELDLNATALAYGDWQLEDVTARFESDVAGVMQGRFQLDGLQSTDRDLGRVDLEIAGPADALATTIGWDGGDIGADFELVAALTRASARGTIKRGELDGARMGVWQLDQAFDFRVDSERVTIGPHAWQSADAALHVDSVDLGENAAKIAARLANVPLAPVAALSTQAVDIDGHVNATIDLVRSAALWRGTLEWKQVDTRIVLDADGAREVVAFGLVEIDGQLEGDSGSLSFALEGDNKTRGQGQFTLSQNDTETRIDGDARIDIDELGWLATFAPGIADLDGRFGLSVDVSGTVNSPSLQGEIGWTAGAVTLTDLGIRLQDINVSGGGDVAHGIEFRGSALSGDGAINMAGSVINALSQERELTLALQGDNVKIIDWQDQKIWVSPDLTFDLGAEGATVAGSLAIPRAEIEVRDLPPSVVSRSKDVKVEGRQDEDGLALPVRGDVTLTLGEEVHIVAFGLDTDLRGDVALLLAPKKAPRFDGRLYLEDGVFSAFGQKLSVDRGNLIYAGPPDNPVLDVQATRRISDEGGDVLAGVRVTGYARNPQVEIYSDPSLPETEALAYLLLGRSSFAGSGSDGDLLSKAALSLGLSKSSPVTVGIAAGLGLDELSLAGSDVDTAELVAGKRLNNKLYVRYSFGVFSEIGTLFLRYRLSDRLSLEAGASDTQSLDLLYSIEK